MTEWKHIAAFISVYIDIWTFSPPQKYSANNIDYLCIIDWTNKEMMMQQLEWRYLFLEVCGLLACSSCSCMVSSEYFSFCPQFQNIKFDGKSLISTSYECVWVCASVPVNGTFSKRANSSLLTFWPSVPTSKGPLQINPQSSSLLTPSPVLMLPSFLQKPSWIAARLLSSPTWCLFRPLSHPAAWCWAACALISIMVQLTSPSCSHMWVALIWAVHGFGRLLHHYFADWTSD